MLTWLPACAAGGGSVDDPAAHGEPLKAWAGSAVEVVVVWVPVVSTVAVVGPGGDGGSEGSAGLKSAVLRMWMMTR